MTIARFACILIGLTGCIGGLFLIAGVSQALSESLSSSIAPVSPLHSSNAIATRPPAVELERYQRYRDSIQQTVGMVSDPTAQQLAEQLGLDIVNVTWEDTGRYYNSAVGPNISDMSIQVQQQNPATGDYELSLMPVIRYPNFSDRSADIPLDQFFVLVGNETGEDLHRVSLRDLLADLPAYLSDPDSWQSDRTSLLADRDTHVLVSAQACFLPVPQGDIAQFNPVLFNYQSYEGHPAVLTILATREGTSITVIDNARDPFEAGWTWGQRLFFNQNGERASFTGQRLSEFVANPRDSSPTASAAGESGLNFVMLIQVPLKQDRPVAAFEANDAMMEAMPLAAPMQRSDVEAAVIGHGAVEGPFTEVDGLAIERDPDFPIRVTVQFYQATSNGIVSPTDMAAIHQQIERVYDEADYVGSLVVDGVTRRPTEYEGNHEEPDDWWEEFWQRYEQRTGRSRQDVIDRFQWLRGADD